ncbi:MAG TPA: hypothetical protein VD931_20600 [Baekduia sp.]|nr:hypothetical protein [Baekduia sp.]
MLRIAGAATALAALTLLAPSQPGYDAWAWLLWGRELTEGTLSTAEGPAFKPLAVAVCALLAPLGDDVAPQAWLLVARAGAIAAVLLAARLALRLTEPRVDLAQRDQLAARWTAAAVAGLGVALSAGWWWHGAVGNSEGLFLALVLAAADRALDNRHSPALGLAAAAALLRPELWPFLGLYGLWLWVRRAAPRPYLAAAAVAIPALWLVPELLASGQLSRSADRAQIPNPGQPATADRPALASLDLSTAVPLLPVLLLSLAALLHGRTRLLAAFGLAWLALVAVMAEAGFSGEARYALPGAALLAVPAAVTLARAPRSAVAAGAAAVLVAAVLRAGAVDGELARAADDARLWSSLPAAIDAAGGRGAVLACGPPVTGRYRGTGVAYALRVEKRRVRFAGDGAVLRSRIRSRLTVQPPVPPRARVLARSARWELRCRA